MHRHHESDHGFHDHPLGRLLHMIGHRHGRGFGRGGFMGGHGFGDGGVPFGRKLGAHQLQLVLLALIAEKPSHGYELIKALEERSNGFYSPSPGMIYPALTYLEEIGYATVEAEGNKKLYRISEAGSAHLAGHRDEVETILAGLKLVGSRMEEVRRAFSGEHGRSDDEFGPDELRRAAREMKRLLRDRRHASPEDLRKIAEILRRAAAEIVTAVP